MAKQYAMFCTALIISIAVTPFIIKFAFKIGAMDVPRDNRRVHKVPVPLIGGLAIYLAFTISVILFTELNQRIVGLLIGGTFIMLSDRKSVV